MAKAIDLQNPNRKQLSLLRKDDALELQDSLELVLVYFANLMQVKDASLDFILPEMAQEILTEYWFFTFDEICLVLRGGITGKYKDTSQIAKQTFDIETVLGWFRNYNDNERVIFVTAHTDKKENNTLDKDFDIVKMYENGIQNKEILDQIEKDREEFEKEEIRKANDYQRVKMEFMSKERVRE